MKQKIKKVFENAVWWSGVVMVGLVLGISLQVVRAWTEPTQAPPNGNVGAPINTSIGQQWKGLGGTGSLGLTGVLETIGLKFNSKFDTAGNIVPDVTGKFLAAKDASGQVAWAAGGGGASYTAFGTKSCATAAGYQVAYDGVAMSVMLDAGTPDGIAGGGGIVCKQGISFPNFINGRHAWWFTVGGSSSPIDCVVCVK